MGTSGWQYPRWRGDFYPRGLAQKNELRYLAARLPTVEVNGTFYSLTRPAACSAWRAEVPDGFVFALKGSRYISHMLKLRHFEPALADFFASGILRLGFAYVRLHGATRLYASRYTDEELGRWAGQATAWTAAGHDVFVYFDNDAEGHAPHDAVRLAARVRSLAA